MTQRLGSSHFHRLASLQTLASLDKRRVLEHACAETDQRSKDVSSLTQEMVAAETNLEGVYGAVRLCLDSLRFAGAIVDQNAVALDKGKEQLTAARVREEEAAQNWMAARHRTQWFEDKTRMLQKKEAARRDDAAGLEARALRLVVRRGNES